VTRLIESCEELSLGRRDYAYQLKELRSCLEVGLLIAALHLACSMIELFVRDLLIAKRMCDRWGDVKPDAPSRAKIVREIEHERELGFPGMLDELSGRALEGEDAAKLGRFYRQIRIPLLHGLVTRFVAPEATFFEDLRGGVDRFRQLEDRIENIAILEIGFVLKQIKKYERRLD